MRYIRAQDIFPAELLEQIQRYVDGQYVYIPRKEDEKRAWGEASHSRQETAERNRAIYDAYMQGVAVDRLADTFYLSEKSIRRILLQEKKKENGKQY